MHPDVSQDVWTRTSTELIRFSSRHSAISGVHPAWLDLFMSAHAENFSEKDSSFRNCDPRGGVWPSDIPKEELMDNRNGETPETAAGAQSAEDSARRVKEAAVDVTQRVKDAAGSAMGDIKTAAGGAMKDAKNAAMQGVEDARAKAGDMGHTTASRFRELAGQVEQDLPWLSGAFSKSAEGLDTVTDSLTRGDLSDVVSNLTDFARRQPAIFLGASVALGFALSRIGKTALESTQTQTTDADNAAQPFDSANSAYPTPTGV
jgi:hypothetical protein